MTDLQRCRDAERERVSRINGAKQVTMDRFLNPTLKNGDHVDSDGDDDDDDDGADDDDDHDDDYVDEDVNDDDDNDEDDDQAVVRLYGCRRTVRLNDTPTVDVDDDDDDDEDEDHFFSPK